MTTLLEKESILHYLPAQIEYKQLMILDSLRFTIELIDINYKCLYNELKETSINKNKKNMPQIFNFAWAVVNYSDKFYSTYKKFSQDPSIEKFNTYAFRNACQHYTSNFDKIINSNKPVYGALKWGVKDPVSNQIYSCLAISGIYNSQEHIIINTAGKKYRDDINDITLELKVIDKKEKRDELNLSELMQEIKHAVVSLEISIKDHMNENGLKEIDWSSRKDILISFHQKEEEKKPISSST